MVTATNKYKGNLRTLNRHERSGEEVITDAPIDNNGKGEAFSPTDLVSSSLASCMMTMMGILAKREEISLEGLKSEVVKVMAENPRRIVEVHITFDWNPEPTITPTQIKKLKNAAITCPVAQSLHPDIKQEITFNF